ARETDKAHSADKLVSGPELARQRNRREEQCTAPLPPTRSIRTFLKARCCHSKRSERPDTMLNPLYGMTRPCSGGNLATSSFEAAGATTATSRSFPPGWRR